MAESPSAPPDMQHLNDICAGVFEAIATLEFAGRRAERGEIVAATGLPDDVIGECLAVMVHLGMLNEGDDGEGVVYLPASRGWSAQPDQAAGKKLG